MKYIILLIALICHQKASANTANSNKAQKASDSNLIDHVHATLSGDIEGVAKSIDNFFGTQRADDEANNTRIRFYTISTKLEGQNPTTQGDLRIQLVLPKTQRRLQLVIESDENDPNDQSNNSASTTQNSVGVPDGPSNLQRTADATSAALRYIVDAAGVRTSFDSGLRFVGKPQIFYRLRFRKNIKLSEKWVFRPVEQIRWLQDEGHFSDTDLDFDRGINHKWSFRFQNNILWNDQDYYVSFINGPSWYHRTTSKIGMSYNVRIQSSNTAAFSVNNYSLSIGYRQLLYKNWFFWTLTPALTFPRENNFHKTPSLTIRFDVILGRV